MGSKLSFVLVIGQFPSLEKLSFLFKDENLDWLKCFDLIWKYLTENDQLLLRTKFRDRALLGVLEQTNEEKNKTVCGFLLPLSSTLNINRSWKLAAKFWSECSGDFCVILREIRVLWLVWPASTDLCYSNPQEATVLSVFSKLKTSLISSGFKRRVERCSGTATWNLIMT